jgi:hypothetical protein
MAISLGTKGYNGVSLVRNVKKFKQNFGDIDWKARANLPPMLIRTKGGKQTFVYRETA